MKATIWHNPKCGTSRNTLAILRETPGLELEVVDYLRDPPTAAELGVLYASAGIRPADGLRRKEPHAAALADASDETILAAMAAEPILIERPLVRTSKGVRLCRPVEKVREIL